MTLLLTAHLIISLAGEPVPPPELPELGTVHTGRATRFGTWANGLRMGCGGTYWSSDPTIVAVGPSRYRTWPCGTVLQIVGPAGTIIGTRQDSCPGCDSYGVIVDLSESAHAAVCGRGTCTVEVREVFGG